MRFVAAIACLLGVASAARAQSTLNRTGSGARAAGMANAFVAVSDDGTAASWNPAGLAQLRKPELALVHTSISRTQSYDGFRSLDGRYAFTNTGDTYGIASPEFVSLAVPFDVFAKATTVQVDWRRQYFLDGHADYPAQRESLSDGSRTPVNQTLNARGHIDRYSVALAMRLSRRTSLGASVSFWDADWEETFTATQPALDGSTDFASNLSASDFGGANLNVGLLLTYPALNVGLVYHAPFEAPLSLERALDSNRAPTSSMGDTDARLRVGKSVALGLAWRPGGSWTLALDVTRDDWSRFEVRDCALCGPAPTNFFDGLPQDRTSTRDTTSVNLGAERLFARGGHVIPLRFGVAYEPQGQMNSDERDPLDYFVAALGGGYNTNSVKLDAAVQYRWGQARGRLPFGVDAMLGESPWAAGEVAVSEFRIKVSVIVRITDTERLRGVLGRVFGGGSEAGDGGS